MIFIGLDAGVKTGIAIWDSKPQEWSTLGLDLGIRPVDTCTFFEAISIVETIAYSTGRSVLCKVEDPSNISTIWHNNKGAKGGKKGLRVAQNVGMNKREAQLLIEGLELIHGVVVDPITPTQSKLDAKTFNKIAGYSQSTSQHARDAGMLVLGLRPMPAAQFEMLLQRKEEK